MLLEQKDVSDSIGVASVAIGPVVINDDNKSSRERPCRLQEQNNGVDDGDETSSVNSQDEALCDILGLASFQAVTFTEEFDTARQPQHDTTSPSLLSPSPFNSRPTPVRLKLPKNVSRYCFAPNDCCAWTIPHLFTKEECQALIEVAANSSHASSQSFDYIRTATHTAADGSTYSVELQNPNPHKLAVFQHAQWVQRLWERVWPFVESDDATVLHDIMKRDGLLRQGNENHNTHSMIAGLNPRLRVLKYDAQDHDEFQAHFDATTTLDGSMTSLITVLLYLNDGGGVDFEGGETAFLPNTIDSGNGDHDNNQKGGDANNTIVTPSTGTVVLFEHDLFHCGRPLLSGTKYVLRTDIMFHMTPDELQQLRAKQREKQQHWGEEEKGNGGAIADGTSNNTPTTMGALLERLCDDTQNDDIKQLLASGLSGLGLLEDTTIETFCAPGRFALQVMLQDVILTTATTLDSAATMNGDQERSRIVRAINRLLDATFEAMKQAS